MKIKDLIKLLENEDSEKEVVIRNSSNQNMSKNIHFQRVYIPKICESDKYVFGSFYQYSDAIEMIELFSE